VKVSVIIPTYNEAENVAPLIKSIGIVLAGRIYEIVVVDDSSPDGTADIVRGLAGEYPIKLISRKGKLGLGTAILTGLYSATGEIRGVIDADLQHPPELLIALIDAVAEGNDIAVGSRYVNGGGMDDWAWHRKLISRGATVLSRPLTRVKDPMSGFFFLHKRVLDGKGFSPTGYKLLLEILVRAYKPKVKEVPYTFRTRKAGQSKLGTGEFTNYLRLLLKLYLFKLRYRWFSGKPSKKSSDSVPAVLSNPAIISASASPHQMMVSIGICAYNEEKNIANLLTSLEEQVLNVVDVKEIFIVSSACKDRTDEITLEYQRRNPIIHLIQQPERKGKASAINLFLKEATGDICVLISADTILLPNSLEHLCLPFLNPVVGMTGCHSVPVNDPKHFMGYVCSLIWGLAHELSMIKPKLGEGVAFRNVVPEISEFTAVDEAAIEAVIRKKNFQLQYVPDAVLLNRGPATVRDFIKQRKRIHTGHLHLRDTTSHEVSSMSAIGLIQPLMHTVKFNLRGIFWTPAAIALEVLSRLMATYQYKMKKENPYIWDISQSTKDSVR